MRDERRLAHVGKADETNIGKQLQFQSDDSLLPRATALEVSRRPIGGRREVDIASTALASAGREKAVAVDAQIRQQLRSRVVVHHGAGGHAQDHVLAALAVAILVRTALARWRPVFVAIAKVEQRGQSFVHFEDHAAAVAAVAARGSALWDVLLSAKGDRAIAAVTAVDADARLVDEGSHEPAPVCVPARGPGRGG